jgi:dTDP-4-amino-4,6-dideoxygalactose transaminase
LRHAAHAIGSTLEGKHAGTWGHIGCFSFFSNKNMTTGEGGMLATEDEALAEKLRLLRSHGMTSLTWDRHRGRAHSYDVVELGYNYRIDEIRSALGRVQLGRLEHNNQRRRQLTDLYRERLGALDLSMPFEAYRGVSAAHLAPVLLPAGMGQRDFMEKMKARGVQTSLHFPPVHRFSAYQDGEGRVPFPLAVTEDVTAREVSLPLYPLLGEEDVEIVCEAVRESLMELSAT